MLATTMSSNKIDDSYLRNIYANAVKRIALVVKARMPWTELDELLQLGAVGMMEAKKRFDASIGVSFEAFAVRRIKGAMIDGIRRDGKRKRGECFFEVDELESLISEVDEEKKDPLSILILKDDVELLVDALKNISKTEYSVLTYHYYEGLNNREIALILNVSEGHASKLRRRSIGSLMHQVELAINRRRCQE